MRKNEKTTKARKRKKTDTLWQKKLIMNICQTSDQEGPPAYKQNLFKNSPSHHKETEENKQSKVNLQPTKNSKTNKVQTD